MVKPKQKESKEEQAGSLRGKNRFAIPERQPRPKDSTYFDLFFKEAGIVTEPPSDNHQLVHPATRIAEVTELTPKFVPSAKMSRPGRADTEKRVVLEESVRTDASRNPDITSARAATETLPISTEPGFLSAIDLYSEFEARWRFVFRKGELRVLKALYDMTYGIGIKEIFTSPAQIAVAADVDKRHCQRVIRKLESMGMVEKGETFNTKTKKGTMYRLHLAQQATQSTSPRVTHLFDEEM